MNGLNVGGSNFLGDSLGILGIVGDNIFFLIVRFVMYMKLLTSFLFKIRRMFCYWIKWIM